MAEWVGLGISLLIAIAGLATALKALKGNDSEAAKNYAEAAVKIIEDNKRLRSLVDSLESEIRTFRNLVRSLEDEVTKLRAENQTLTDVNEGLRAKLKDFAAFQAYLDTKNALKE